MPRSGSRRERTGSRLGGFGGWFQGCSRPVGRLAFALLIRMREIPDWRRGRVVAFEIIQELAAAAGHLQEAPAGVEVLPMGAQMLGQMIDPSRQKRNLNLA